MAQPVIQPAYEVEPLDGTRIEKRFRREDNRNVEEEVEVPAGFMVYFPRGHSIRVGTEEELKRLGYNNPANLIDVESGEVVGSTRTSLKQRVQRHKSNKQPRADTGAADANQGD